MDAGEPMAMWQPGLIFLGEGDIADVMPSRTSRASGLVASL